MVLIGLINDFTIEKLEELVERQLNEDDNIINEYIFNDDIEEYELSNIYHVNSYEIHDCDLEKEYHVKEYGYKKIILYVESENECLVCSQTNDRSCCRVKVVDIDTYTDKLQIYNAYISEDVLYDAYKEYIEYFEEMVE